MSAHHVYACAMCAKEGVTTCVVVVDSIICVKLFTSYVYLLHLKTSRGGLAVERSLHKKRDFAAVVRI